MARAIQERGIKDPHEEHANEDPVKLDQIVQEAEKHANEDSAAAEHVEPGTPCAAQQHWPRTKKAGSPVLSTSVGRLLPWTAPSTPRLSQDMLFFLVF